MLTVSFFKIYNSGGCLFDSLFGTLIIEMNSCIWTTKKLPSVVGVCFMWEQHVFWIDLGARYKLCQDGPVGNAQTPIFLSINSLFLCPNASQLNSGGPDLLFTILSFLSIRRYIPLDQRLYFSQEHFQFICMIFSTNGFLFIYQINI